MLFWLTLPLTAVSPVSTGLDPAEIVLSSDRTGFHQIYTMDVNGGAPSRLLETEREDRHPRWSPDGEWIAFESAGGGTRDVWIVRAGGADSRRVTNDGCTGQPAWAPDGKRLVVVSTRSGAPALWTIDLESGREAPVSVGRAFCRWPDWSPDGTRIAFSSLADGDEEIFCWNLRDRTVERLTESSGADTRPRWSRDGAEIVFTRSSPRTGGSDMVMRMSSDGESVESPAVAMEDAGALRRAYVDRSVATWGGAKAADGAVVFTSIRGGNADLFVIERGSSQVRQVTNSPAMEQDPDWRPRGAPRKER
ncbi:MAG: hypothetical protein AAF726_13860 [Planctomycetota bacterium]